MEGKIGRIVGKLENMRVDRSTGEGVLGWYKVLGVGARVSSVFEVEYINCE